MLGQKNQEEESENHNGMLRQFGVLFFTLWESG